MENNLKLEGGFEQLSDECIVMTMLALVFTKQIPGARKLMVPMTDMPFGGGDPNKYPIFLISYDELPLLIKRIQKIPSSRLLEIKQRCMDGIFDLVGQWRYSSRPE